MNEIRWNECPHCQAPDAYLRKAVPRNALLGLLLIYLVGALYLLSRNWVAGMAALVLIALVDFILYRILPDVLVCYGCSSTFRRFERSPEFKPFDPHMGERYRQQRLRQGS